MSTAHQHTQPHRHQRPQSPAADRPPRGHDTTMTRYLAHIPRSGLAALLILLIQGSALSAQSTSISDSSPDSPPPTTTFSHPEGSRWWLSGQLNLISQAHGDFPSAYEGDNSLRSHREQALSSVWTIYTGVQLSKHTELLFDIESAGGRGLSDALGVAGFTNLDVVRNPTLGSKPYVARVMLHQTIALSRETATVTRGPLSLATEQATRRLEIRAGKLGLVDFFDLNAAGSDSHLQFTNWTVDNNGAYDYAADTRGYTWAVIVEYNTPTWSIRGAEALMPTVANGITMDWNIARARGENVELELHLPDGLVFRALGYLNHANMGSYEEAIQAFRAGTEAKPDIEAHRLQGRRKYGVGANLEYAIAKTVRVFGRAGWNEGHNESFAYTEVNNCVQAGADMSGRRWNRNQDRLGVAAVSNGLSDPHREYLALGGLGFLLGDNALRYAREDILEAYYTAHLWRGVSASGGLQYIDHPGYNVDRGPVLVGMARLHVDF